MLMSYQFLTFAWEKTVYEIMKRVKIHMIIVINDILRQLCSSSGNRIDNKDELNNWILSIEAIEFLHVLWPVLFGIFNDSAVINQLINSIKQEFGIDFQNFQNYSFLLNLLNYILRQTRKPILREMNKFYSIIL